MDKDKLNNYELIYKQLFKLLDDNSNNLNTYHIKNYVLYSFQLIEDCIKICEDSELIFKNEIIHPDRINKYIDDENIYNFFNLLYRLRNMICHKLDFTFVFSDFPFKCTTIHPETKEVFKLKLPDVKNQTLKICNIINLAHQNNIHSSTNNQKSIESNNNNLLENIKGSQSDKTISKDNIVELSKNKVNSPLRTNTKNNYNKQIKETILLDSDDEKDIIFI
jgi:hypothetical protein